VIDQAKRDALKELDRMGGTEPGLNQVRTYKTAFNRLDKMFDDIGVEDTGSIKGRYRAFEDQVCDRVIKPDGKYEYDDQVRGVVGAMLVLGLKPSDLDNDDNKEKVTTLANNLTRTDFDLAKADVIYKEGEFAAAPAARAQAREKETGKEDAARISS
jgi:hypothetical protein